MFLRKKPMNALGLEFFLGSRGLTAVMKKFEAFGKYTLIKKIATGGMAEIFLVAMPKTAGATQFAVVKRVLPHLTSNKSFREMFKNEGRIAINLKHSNMVSIYEFGFEKNMYYMAMEYISGRNLKNWLLQMNKRKLKISIPCSIYIIRSVASALHYAHNSIDQSTGMPLNLIHRDISPHNVMIDFNANVKLIDFGIAKNTDTDFTNSGVVKGKFSYMSPEQIQGKKLDYRTDIFSLGAVFWELLTGQKLFFGNNVNSIIDKIRTCSIPEISNWRKNTPKPLKDIIYNSLAKDRKNRYESMEQFERDLGLILNRYYPKFSTFDFHDFLKSLYQDEILEERKSFIEISKQLDKFYSNKGVFEKSNYDFSVESNLSSSMKEEEDSAEEEKKKSLKKMSKAEKKQSKKGLERKNKEKSKKPLPENDPTVLSPKAPVYYARTNVIKDTGGEDIFDIEKPKLKPVKVSPQEPAESAYYAATSFSQALESVSTSSKSVKFKRNSLGISILAVLAGLFYFGWPQGGLMDSGKQFIQKFRSSSGERGVVEETPSVIEERNRGGNSSVSMYAVKKTAAGKKNRRPASFSGFEIFVETHPSGAAVYLNEENSGVITPGLVRIPLGFSGRMIIKKSGYENKAVGNFENSKNHLDLVLKKIRKKKRKKRRI